MCLIGRECERVREREDHTLYEISDNFMRKKCGYIVSVYMNTSNGKFLAKILRIKNSANNLFQFML